MWEQARKQGEGEGLVLAQPRESDGGPRPVGGCDVRGDEAQDTGLWMRGAWRRRVEGGA